MLQILHRCCKVRLISTPRASLVLSATSQNWKKSWCNTAVLTCSKQRAYTHMCCKSMCVPRFAASGRQARWASEVPGKSDVCGQQEVQHDAMCPPHPACNHPLCHVCVHDMGGSCMRDPLSIDNTLLLVRFLGL